jgi:two-component system, chemotaxis family, sensor kinase CheA
MSPSDEDFLRLLRATFKVEAAEHLQAIAQGLMALEQTNDTAAQAPIVETMFRAAHSLKGAARAVDLIDIEGVCQSLESLFAAWKRRESAPTSSSLDTAHLALDRMQLALGDSAAAPPPTPLPLEPAPEVAPAAAPPKPSKTAATAAAVVADETVRVAVRSLDDRLLEAEEMLSAKIAARQREVDIGELSGAFDGWRREWARVQTEARALRRAEAGGLAEFLEWNHDWLRALESRVAGLHRAAEHDRIAVDKLVDELLENSKRLLMLPFSTITGGLPKIVRDLARELGKEVDLVVRGEETRVDKRILE